MARYRVIPERSHLWAEARSSLHPIRVETTGLTGYIEADLENGEPRLGAPFRVELDTERLKSGNALTDNELQRRLETRKFPRVSVAVREVQPLSSPAQFRLRGDLSLHGVTRATEADVKVRAIDEKTIEIEGEKVIDIQDFGLTPPKLLFLRVFPDVKVRARLVAEREA